MNISINVNQYDETKLSFGRRNPDNAKSVRSTLAKKRADKLVGNIFQSDKKMDLSVNEMKEKRERDGNAEKSDQICISVSFCFARGESGMFVSSI